jgi:hypothetical protein
MIFLRFSLRSFPINKQTAEKEQLGRIISYSDLSHTTLEFSQQ